MLKIENLHVRVAGKEILKGLQLHVGALTSATNEVREPDIKPEKLITRSHS